MKSETAIALAGVAISAVGNIAFIWWIVQQNKTIASYERQAKAVGIVLTR